MSAWLETIWYRQAPPPVLLKPLAAAYGAIADRLAALRKARQVKLAVPVIVVGNITVGGTGKTPFTLWLVEQLRGLGWLPGVVSRGYGGRAPKYPLRVTAMTDAALCGDEPALIARRLSVPVAVAPSRVAAARLLIGESDADILIADDGLQHYRLGRDLEICVIDGVRGFGNGARLPAGPLRELPARLAQVDLVVINGDSSALRSSFSAPVIEMRLEISYAVAFADGEVKGLSAFVSHRVHAVAGIGNPARFFAALRAAGLELIVHPFPDHHRYTELDLYFNDDLPVLMTEKDAVKCRHLAVPRLWSVPARAVIGTDDTARVRELLLRFKR